MGKMTWKLRLMLAASFETVSNKQKQKNELANFWYSGFLCGQRSPPLPTASLVCPWRTADCGWCGMSWSWIKQLLGPQKTKLFQCDRPQNKFQGRSILWLLSCGKNRRLSQYISIISHLSHFTMKHPFGSARILPKKGKWHPEQKKIRAVHPQKPISWSSLIYSPVTCSTPKWSDVILYFLFIYEDVP